MSDVTRILESLDGGDPDSAAELLPLVYDDLRRLAAARLARERSGITLQATELVNEAWIRLAGPGREGIKWNGRRHFFAAAAQAIRRILVDHARRKMAVRRGGDWVRVTFGDVDAPIEATPPEIIDLNEALERLASKDAEKAELADLRLFGGLTLEEAARALGVSMSTVKRRWRYIQAWLSRELSRAGEKAELD